MTDNKELRKKLILNNPNDSATKLLDKAKALGISNRKTIFLSEVRELRKLPEPTTAKREASIPKKYKPTPKIKAKPKAKPKVKPKAKPKVDIPFEQTKFGKITRDLQKEHRISEKNAIKHARKLLKIPKSDYDKINERDVQILLAHTP